MAGHAKDALRGPGIAQIFDFAFAISASEAFGAERLVACEDGKIFNLVATRTAAVRTAVAYKRSIAEQ